MDSEPRRNEALDGPWEIQSDLFGTFGIHFVDSDGLVSYIGETYSQDYADLLVHAWAVPLLVNLLRRMVQAWDPHDHIAVEAHALLEKLS